MSVEFFLTALIVVLLPGTGVLYTLAVGLGRGFRASVAAAIGGTLGILPAALACVAGLAALLHTSALAFAVLKWLGVAYLGYMAWGILREGSPLDVEANDAPLGGTQIAVTAILMNVLNPKLTLFFLAFLPQFVPLDAQQPTLDLLGLTAVFMALTFAVFVAYGACAAAARDQILQRPQVMTWIRRGFAGSFALLGAKLALSD